jgi:DNA-binding MarR family transcriptional regulator
MRMPSAQRQQASKLSSDDIPADATPHLHLPGKTALGYQLRLTDEMLRGRLHKRILSLGVRLAQWNYLRVLWEEDGISQQELSARASRLGSNTTTALGILERRGLVRRKRSRSDRRVMHVFLTTKARSKQDGMIRAALEVMALATAGISNADILHLFRTLARIQKNLGADDSVEG